MLGGRAHPGFRSWGLPRCIDQGVDLRSSARPDLKVAVSLSAPRRILSDRRRRQNRTIVSLITARSRSPAMPETSLVVVDPGHFHATLVLGLDLAHILPAYPTPNQRLTEFFYGISA